MKKFFSLFASLAIITMLMVVQVSAEEVVYGTATLTYAEFYAGDVTNAEGIDVVTSATHEKADMFVNVATDFVDEETNKDGYHLVGVKGVNVAVAAADVEAYKAINPTFEKCDEVPVQYKPVSMEMGEAVYGATVLHVADTVTDAQIEIVTDSHWGDYQINIEETSTKYIRNTREDEGFALGSGIQGIIVETASGLQVGMQHMQSIWVQPWEISFNVSADNSHNEEITYDQLSELDRLMGETVTKVTFINADDAYVYEFEGAYLPVKFPSSMAVEDARSTEGRTTVMVEGLPEDYEPIYAVEGLHSEVKDGALIWSEDLPGAYTLVLQDGKGKYAQLSAEFVLSSDVLPVAYDAQMQELTLAEGANEGMMEAFIRNLETVTVNDVEYRAAGRGAAVIINNLGELDSEAALTKGKGAEAEVIPVFPQSGTYTITAKATGFDQTLTFEAEVIK